MAPKRKVEKNPVEKSTKSDSKVFYLEFLTAAQKLAWNVYQNHDVVFLTGPAGTGKAEPLDAIVYTPNGPKTMGEMKVGDVVCTPDGGNAPVLAVYPQGEKDIYKITFTDGDSVECCLEHLWKIDNYGVSKKNMVVDTKYIIDNLKIPSGKNKIHIQTPQVVEFNSHELLIPPYLMGALLGDGCFTGNHLSFTSADEQVVKNVSEELGSDKLVLKDNRQIDYRVVGTETRNCLKSMGLWDKRAWEKSIPEEYVYTSSENRLEILRGLMDTGGTISKKTGMPKFCTMSPELAKSVKTIVQSLGGICVIKKTGRPAFCCHIRFNDNKSMFKAKRKQIIARNRTKCPVKRVISSVECVGRKLAQCIHIGSKEHLYLTDNFIVTHNSHLAVGFALQELFAGSKENVVITRPIVEAGENLGFLPGSLSEKVDPYMMPLYDCLTKMVGKAGTQRTFVEERLEVAPLAYMRGRSQPIDSKVLTPCGYRKMGSLKVGDFVIGKDGKPTKIMGVYPQGKLDVYCVKFSDGVSVECSADHLWSTMTLDEKRHNRGFTTKNTTEILKTVKNKHNQKIHRIPVCEPVEFSQKTFDLLLDPYVLGAILGDGNCHKKASPTLTSADTEIVSKIASRIPEGHSLVMAKPKKGKTPQYRIVSKSGEVNKVSRALDFWEIRGLKSHQKFIPVDYMTASVDQRVELLRGLMDMDGSIFTHRSGNPRIQFHSTSRQLTEGVVGLVQSLGGVASLKKREYEEDDQSECHGNIIRHCHPGYVVDMVMKINPFSLSCKADAFVAMKPQRIISSVELIGKKDCQCIRVDAYDSLYLTNDCVVTHNTFEGSVCILDEAQNCTMAQLTLFLTRLGNGTKMIITGDPDQSDLFRNGRCPLAVLMDMMSTVDGIGTVEFPEAAIVRHPLVGKILRRLKENNVSNPLT
jgi:phosphate starvation-inducible PhoH-like protein